MTRTTTLTHFAVLTALFCAATIPASAQMRVVFNCKNPGKYKLFFPGQTDHYCYDKQLYTVSGMPPHVREYFAEQERKDMEARQADRKARAEFRARWEARRAAEQQPTRAAVAAPAAQRALVASAPAPAPPPPPRQVALDLVKEIPVGATRSTVIAKLGQPHGRIFGSEETFSYLTPSGSARLKLSEGKVTSVVLPQQ